MSLSKRVTEHAAKRGSERFIFQIMKFQLVVNLRCYFGVITQSAFTFTKLTVETLEQGVKYVQS